MPSSIVRLTFRAWRPRPASAGNRLARKEGPRGPKRSDLLLAAALAPMLGLACGTTNPQQLTSGSSGSGTSGSSATSGTSASTSGSGTTSGTSACNDVAPGGAGGGAGDDFCSGIVACLDQDLEPGFYDQCIAEICPACPLADAMVLSYFGANCAEVASDARDAGRILSASCAQMVMTIFGAALDAGYDAG